MYIIPVGEEEDAASQEQLFVTVMELVHTIVWRIKDQGPQNSQVYFFLMFHNFRNAVFKI